MGFLELQQELGVYSRVTAGVILQISCLFSDVRTPVYLRGTPQEYPRGLEGQYHASRGEVGDPVSLYSCRNDIVIFINFQEAPGIVTF